MHLDGWGQRQCCWPAFIFYDAKLIESASFSRGLSTIFEQILIWWSSFDFKVMEKHLLVKMFVLTVFKYLHSDLRRV